MRPKSTSGAAFRAQTFPFMHAVYSDAFCLTGSPKAAADLVVAAYVRASQSYDQFRRRRTPECLRARSTLAWLFGNLHAAFCAGVLTSPPRQDCTHAVNTYTACRSCDCTRRCPKSVG